MTVTDTSLASGLIVMFISSVLCSSAGVGGGSLNVPILYSIIGFDYDTAVVLSACTLMGNYLLQFLINLDKRHPCDPTVPLIYWDAVLIMLPAELGGANVGVIISKSIPKPLIFILAIVVLIIAIFFTGLKGYKLYKNENIALLTEHDDEKTIYGDELITAYTAYTPIETTQNNQNNTTTTPLLTDSLKLVDIHSDIGSELNWPSMVRKANAKRANKVTLGSIIPPYLYCYSTCGSTICIPKRYTYRTYSLADSDIYSEYTHTDNTDNDYIEQLPPLVLPYTIITVITTIFLLYLICYIIQKQYTQCSIEYYICLCIIYTILLIQIIWGLWYLIKQRCNTILSLSRLNIPLEGDIYWDTKSIFIPVISFCIGITSALLGIGGGELMGPMMLVLKVRFLRTPVVL